MNQTLKLASVATAAAIGSAFAGPAPIETLTPAPLSHGDWCDSLQTFGKFHEDKNDRFIQGVKFFGRFQWQYAAVDGDDVNGDSFENDFTEFRRIRVGTEIKFLNNFTLKGNLNLIDDDATSGGSETFGFTTWDQLKLTYKAKNVAGFDSLAATYGRHKVAVGHEAHTSSKKIKTVERSALSNTLFGPRYTGFSLKAEKGDWSGTFGFFNTENSSGLADQSAGEALYLN